MTTNDIVAAVKAHAMENYENEGWDFLVECYSDKDISEWVEQRGWTTVEAAISGIGRIMRIKDEQRRDVQAEIF